MAERSPTSPDELRAFEDATRDLVGVALRSIEQSDVSLPQFRLLLVLHERGRSTSTHCAHELGVVGSSVTRLADRLHASGHLRRGTAADNRSTVTLELTEEGRRVVRAVTARRRRELKRLLDGLDPADRAGCAATLSALHHLADGDGADRAHDRLPL